jgi:hypothetical protein
MTPPGPNAEPVYVNRRMATGTGTSPETDNATAASPESVLGPSVTTSAAESFEGVDASSMGTRASVSDSDLPRVASRSAPSSTREASDGPDAGSSGTTAIAPEQATIGARHAKAKRET